jgi:site-specific DNA recombinase
MISVFEARIEKLERKRIAMAERVANVVPPTARLEDCIELALRFLSSP